MHDTSHQAELSLPEMLSARAHGASTRRLALDLGFGLLVAMVVFIARPAGWVLLGSAATCFAAFGGWGLAERIMSRRTMAAAREFRDLYMPDFSPSPVADMTNLVLRVVEGVAVLVGVLAALLLVFGVLALLLGTMIS